MKRDNILGSLVLFLIMAALTGATYMIYWTWDYHVQEKKWPEVSRKIDEVKLLNQGWITFPITKDILDAASSNVSIYWKSVSNSDTVIAIDSIAFNPTWTRGYIEYKGGK